jgi:prepilin-type N-terminal cleavage/methylation domain-containing protein
MVQHGERGVTLLELLVAMTLLAVVLVGLAASYPLAMVGVSIGGYRTTAALLAQQCIDIARNIALYGAAGAFNASALQTALTAQCPSETPFGPRFTRTVQVTDGLSAGGGSDSVPNTVQVVTITVNFPVDTGIQPLEVRTIVNPGF